MASGGMYTSVPGHMVKVRRLARGLISPNLAIPKSVTLALTLLMRSTLLLERSLWTMPFAWRSF